MLGGNVTCGLQDLVEFTLVKNFLFFLLGKLKVKVTGGVERLYLKYLLLLWIGSTT